MRVSLSDLHSVLEQLESCSQGLAYFDHIWAKAVDEEAEAEATMENVMADAARAARDDAPKAATAAEINGRITEWISERPSKAKAREDLREARKTVQKLERFARSLEKRGSLAQSAKDVHDQLNRYGG